MEAPLQMYAERVLSNFDQFEGEPSMNPDFVRHTLEDSTDRGEKMYLVLFQGEGEVEVQYQVDEGGTHNTVLEKTISRPPGKIDFDPEVALYQVIESTIDQAYEEASKRSYL